MNIAVIGNTWATRAYIDTVRELGHTVTVFQEPWSASCAGWEDLGGYRYEEWTDYTPYDLVQVIGFSKLIHKFDERWCGFHPTDLPRGRGRAPLPWMILEPALARPAATFFRLTAEPDAGAIYQQTLGVERVPDDWYIGNLCLHIEDLIRAAVREWFGRLKIFAPTPQDEQAATYLGVRRPCDSEIDWHGTNSDVLRTVRAHSYPYPGAWSGSHHVWRAAYIDTPYHGVVGRVVTTVDGAPVVQCGSGQLQILKYDGPTLNVGDDL